MRIVTGSAALAGVVKTPATIAIEATDATRALALNFVVILLRIPNSLALES